MNRRRNNRIARLNVWNVTWLCISHIWRAMCNIRVQYHRPWTGFNQVNIRQINKTRRDFDMISCQSGNSSWMTFLSHINLAGYWMWTLALGLADFSDLNWGHSLFRASLISLGISLSIEKFVFFNKFALLNINSTAHIHKLNSNSTSTHTPIRSVEVTLEEALSEWCSSADLVFTISTPPRLRGGDSSYTPDRISLCKKRCGSQKTYNFRA